MFIGGREPPKERELTRGGIQLHFRNPGMPMVLVAVALNLNLEGLKGCEANNSISRHRQLSLQENVHYAMHVIQLVDVAIVAIVGNSFYFI